VRHVELAQKHSVAENIHCIFAQERERESFHVAVIDANHVEAGTGITHGAAAGSAEKIEKAWTSFCVHRAPLFIGRREVVAAAAADAKK